MQADTVQELIDRLREGPCSLEETRALACHPAALVRVNAIDRLGRLASTEEVAIDDLRRAATDAVNQTQLMGTTRVAHVALATLLRVGTDVADQTAQELIDDWPESDKQDLLWYLQSEGLPVGQTSAPGTN
jgi:uncharacterized Fe-S center protein